MNITELTPICPYCKDFSKKVKGDHIYPHRKDLHQKSFYCCDKCSAWVGCHPNTDKPLGRLADKKLRALKGKTHKYFDAIWKDGHMSRKDAYAWLADAMDISQDECHIGMFDEFDCQEAADLCYEKESELSIGTIN